MIEGVALRLGSHLIVMHKPARHSDLLREMIASGRSPASYEQGFVSEGEFLTREQAEVHARACGQLTKPLIGSVLTSEDLW